MTVVPIAAARVGAAAAGGGGASGAAAAAAGRTSAAGGRGAAAGGSASGRSSGAVRRPAGGSRSTGSAPAGSSPVATAFENGSQSLTAGEKKFDAATRQLGSLSLTPPKRLTATDGAGFLGGLFLYVLALNYLRHGPDGVKGWLAAKFVNRPWTPPTDDGGADGERDNETVRT